MLHFGFACPVPVSLQPSLYCKAATSWLHHSVQQFYLRLPEA